MIPLLAVGIIAFALDELAAPEKTYPQKVQCAYCKQFMAPQLSKNPNPPISHGMCKKCQKIELEKHGISL